MLLALFECLFHFAHEAFDLEAVRRVRRLAQVAAVEFDGLRVLAELAMALPDVVEERGILLEPVGLLEFRQRVPVLT